MYEPSLYTLIFISGEKFYLYNSRFNFFSEISEALYKAIDRRDWDSLPAEVVEELKRREIIVRPDERYDFYYSELLKFNARNNDRNTLGLVIAPTTACNFACPYCFEPKDNPRTMTDEVIDEIVGFVKKHDGLKSVTLTWYGGEPLMAFDKMKRLYGELSQEGMPEIGYQTIITNGYLFTDEVIDFFKTNGCRSIQITIDGLGDKHNATRCLKNSSKPTFETIVSNIDKIVSELPDTAVNVRVNINKSNYRDFVEVLRFFQEKYPDNKKLSVYPGIIREETSDRRSLCDTSFSPSQMLELYELLRNEGVDTSDFPKRSAKGCMMHFIGGYLIGPEGEVYKCWNDVSDAGCVVGKIGSSELTNSSRYIKYAIQAIPFNDECRECRAFPICDGGCAYHRYRNMFEGCNFDLCSPYKDVERLKKALLSGKLPE